MQANMLSEMAYVPKFTNWFVPSAVVLMSSATDLAKRIDCAPKTPESAG